MADPTSACADDASMAGLSCSKHELSEAKNKSSGDQSVLESQVIIVDASLEKKLVRKFDLNLLPLLAVMYFFNSIDRSNLGNAKTNGIEADLGMKGNEYSITLILFYLTFSLFDLPVNLLIKKYSAKIMLPLLMTGWGCMTLIQCAASSWAGLVICRIFIGLFEAGFFAGLIFYLTIFYKRNELALRLAVLYASSTVAGAFSGLLAYGVFQIQSHVPGWKWLFIIEGAATLIIAGFAYWHLPKTPSTCSWLTAEERALAALRMRTDGTSVVDEKFNLKTALHAIVSWRVMLWALIGFCYGESATAVSNFLPQFVARLGYSTVKTNLFTVAPYATGAVFLLLVARSSDHFRERSLHMAAVMCLTIIGFIILATVDTLTNTGVAYFACFLLTCGVFTPSVLFHSWHNNNQTSETGRAAITGFLVGTANLSGIVSSVSFAANTAPQYYPAMYLAVALQSVGIVLVLVLGAWLRWDNRRRDREQGVKLRPKDVSTDVLSRGYADPSWRWTA